MKALRLPTPHPGRFWFATGFRAVLRGSCSPKRSRADGGAARAWAVWSAGGPVPAGVRVDGVGSHRFPGDPSRAFALLKDPDSGSAGKLLVIGLIAVSVFGLYYLFNRALNRALKNSQKNVA